MPKGKSLNTEILRAALEGLELQKQRLDGHIAEVRRLLAGTPKKSAVLVEAKRPRPKLSAAARKRIGAATKKSWAEFRKQKATAAKK